MAPEDQAGVFAPHEKQWRGDTSCYSDESASRQGQRMNLPAKKELGVCVPLGPYLEALELNGELDVAKQNAWMAALGDTTTPLDNEDVVVIKAADKGNQMQILKRLRAYREVMSIKGNCPPVTALGVQRHIDTGESKPIMLKHRRQAQTDEALFDENSSAMLQNGVI